MPRKRVSAKGRLMRLVLFSLAGWALLALGRGPSRRPVTPPHTAVNEPESVPGWASSPAPVPERTSRRLPARRLATSLAFATLFFAGASLSAVAGDTAVRFLEANGGDCAEPAEMTAEAEADAESCEDAAAAPAETEAAPAAEEAPAEAEAEATASSPSAEPTGVSEDAGEQSAEWGAGEAAAEAAASPEAAPAADEAAEEAFAPRAPRARRGFSHSPNPNRPAPAPDPHVDPEATQPGTDATVWLHRVLPDPTPASLRLAPWFAKKLRGTAREHRIAWPLLLGVMRADGVRASHLVGRAPTMDATARRLKAAGARHDAWSAALAVTGRTVQADRAVALANYYRAVGLRALVRGLRAERKAIAKRVLADEHVTIYDAGRADIEADRVDVRVVALIAYLRQAHGEITVSSLIAGHRLYARPGVVSAHVYGHAVDISSLGGETITGNSEPGGLTEKAVRNILLLPAEMLPRQVISLLGLGGPSFPLANHWDHIHVGY